MKRQYALKISRNTRSKVVNVHPITIAPPGAVPYRLKYPRPYYAESLQLFSTRAEARAAFEAEKIAAEFSEKPDSELYSIFMADIDRVAKIGISVVDLCRITHAGYRAVVSTVSRGKIPNSRTTARLHLIADRLDSVAKFAASVLPESGGCGNPRKSRGGQPDIWMKQKRYQAKK